MEEIGCYFFRVSGQPPRPDGKRTPKRGRASSKDDDSDEVVKKAPALLAFAREAKPVSKISAKDIDKGITLTNIFARWRRGKDRVLPYKALKFIAKEVASPMSEFLHPVRGIYSTLVSEEQQELRDAKLRNIFEDVVYKLVPGRQLRLNEYEAAEQLRDKGGKLAKAARKRRAKSESVLLSRLAIECELCMMGSKSWSEFDGALRGDGVAEAIRTSFRNSSDDSSDEDVVSMKTAASAWKRAVAARVASPRSKKSKQKSFGKGKKPKHDSQLVATFQSGLAEIKRTLANGGWAKSPDVGGAKREGGANHRGRKDGGGGSCWHCGEDGHSFWQKSKCPLAGKDPAPGTKHANMAPASGKP